MRVGGAAQERGVKVFGIVVQRLPAVVIIQRGPACHGPTVIYLPVQRTHAPPAVGTPVLHSVADGLGLQYL